MPAAACIPITQEKIRAEIRLGNTILAATPFVLNFSVQKSRNQISSTFSATFEMIGTTSFPLGEKLSIWAGTKGNLKRIMTGMIESTNAQPAFGKPSYFTLQVAGRGVLSDLENKKFTRRLKTAGQGVFCLITGGSSNRPQAFYSIDKTVQAGNHSFIYDSPNPAFTGGEQSPLIVNRDNGTNQSEGGLPKKLAGRTQGGDEDRGAAAGLDIHTHESLEQGGPAFAVYSSD